MAPRGGGGVGLKEEVLLGAPGLMEDGRIWGGKEQKKKEKKERDRGRDIGDKGRERDTVKGNPVTRPPSPTHCQNGNYYRLQKCFVRSENVSLVLFNFILFENVNFQTDKHFARP